MTECCVNVTASLISSTHSDALIGLQDKSMIPDSEVPVDPYFLVLCKCMSRD